MSLRIPKSAIILLGVAAILLFILVIIIFLSVFNGNTSSNEPDSPTPTRVKSSLRTGDSPIKPTNISPGEDTTGSTIKNPSQQILITTNKEISAQSIKVSVSPNIPVKVQQGENPDEILVFPDPPEYWRPDVLYTISVFDSTNKLITSYKIKVPRFTVPYDPL